jgi:hypothetical protein
MIRRINKQHSDLTVVRRFLLGVSSVPRPTNGDTLTPKQIVLDKAAIAGPIDLLVEGAGIIAAHRGDAEEDD